MIGPRAMCWAASWAAAALVAATTIAPAQTPRGGPKFEHPPPIGEPVIRLRHGDGRPARVELAGLSREALAAIGDAKIDRRRGARILPLYVAGAGRGETPPVLGDYTLEGDVLVLTPKYPLRPGVEYRVRFDPGGIFGPPHRKRNILDAVLSLPALPAAPPTNVTAVYPTGDVLPENLLKFYVHFSASMSRGESYRHVRILDDAGMPVPDAILEIGEELWDAEGRRLTLLFDPGRIKRGLKPREEVGTSLVAGRAYSLVISRQWRDGRRQPLAAEHVKRFTVAPPDDGQPDPRRWKLTPPAAGTRDPLVVTLDEPLDHALLQRVVRIVGPSEDETSGEVAIEKHETQWRFQPTAAWKAGAYQLVVAPELEDLAGNSIARPFEVDQFAPPGEPASAGGPRKLPFTISPAP